MAQEELLRELIKDGDVRMQKCIEATRHDLQSIRTGRANPSLVERVEVSYYGSIMPLPQMATVTAPEPRMLLISPWDKSALPAIEKAIQKSDLGLNPSSDGINIRLVIPSLTQETRKNLIRNVHKRVEEGKVSVRNVRRDIIEDLRSLKKGGDIGEDEEKRTEAEVQKLTDRHIHQLDNMQKSKEEELLEV